MRHSKHRTSSPSRIKKSNSSRNLIVGGICAIATIGGVGLISDLIENHAEKKDLERQLKNDINFTKKEIRTLDSRFLSEFKEVARKNARDYIISYWGVDRFGDRALVVVFSNGSNPKLTVLKFAPSSLPELNALSPYMDEFLSMDDKTDSVIYKKIMSGRITHSTEHGYVDKKELGDSLSYHTDNYANGSGSYNSAMMFLLLSNSSYHNNAKMNAFATDKLHSNREAFTKSENRSGAYTGGSGGGGGGGVASITNTGGKSGYSGKSQAIGARAGFGHGG
ncbi:hypothetical protein LMH73_020885 [Vibrio splendidus]|nr:hypothetical protein [Vibrio splendidus]MCC4880354.1 hypothetical protein [Vibrio splendidus]